MYSLPDCFEREMEGQIQHKKLWRKADDAGAPKAAKHSDPRRTNMSDHSNKALTGLCGQG